MENMDPAFSALQEYNQFVLYRVVASKARQGKTDKFPISSVTGKVCDGQDPKNWLSAHDAIEKRKMFSDDVGVGFVFTEDDPFFFLDIDNSLLPNNEWNEVSQQLCGVLAGAAVEISSSMNGLHIIGKSEPIQHTCKNTNFNIELYTSKRFVALTGANVVGTTQRWLTDELKMVVDKYFSPVDVDANLPGNVWRDGPIDAWNGPEDDIILLQRAMRRKNPAAVFGSKASFQDLWEANEDALSVAFPDTTRVYDASSADASLASHLAFWTGCDHERIINLMRQSKLNRDKWTRDDYLPRTILAATANKKEVLHDKKVEARALSAVTSASETIGEMRSDAVIVNPTQQIELFKNCVYVLDKHEVLIPGGDLIDPKRFKSLYGGYSLILDANNEKTTNDAFKAFTESQAVRFPRVHTTAFLPLEPSGSIVDMHGRAAVNTYYPAKVHMQEGDPSLFIKHIQKLLPVERDRDVLLAWLAACVQYKGVKFLWAPFLQGVEGNGKSIVSQCVAYAVGRQHSYFVNAETMTEKFNSWLCDNIFIGVEDIDSTKSKQDIIEFLKPRITQEYLEIRYPGGTKGMKDICCNFIFNSNYKDGLRKTKNDRRLAPLYTNQQQKEDLDRDGLNQQYFDTLKHWLDSENGYAIVAHYLMNYSIPKELNPASKNRAPHTSSTDEAIEHGLGYVEQEILEQVEQGTTFFRGGYVSSTGLDHLLERIGMSRMIPPTRRRVIMQNLGYRYHPALKRGRVNNTVLPDGNKPTLYIKDGSAGLKLATGSDVAKAYQAAQQQD